VKTLGRGWQITHGREIVRFVAGPRRAAQPGRRRLRRALKGIGWLGVLEAELTDPPGQLRGSSKLTGMLLPPGNCR